MCEASRVKFAKAYRGCLINATCERFVPARHQFTRHKPRSGLQGAPLDPFGAASVALQIAVPLTPFPLCTYHNITTQRSIPYLAQRVHLPGPLCGRSCPTALDRSSLPRPLAGSRALADPIVRAASWLEPGEWSSPSAPSRQARYRRGAPSGIAGHAARIPKLIDPRSGRPLTRGRTRVRVGQ